MDPATVPYTGFGYVVREDGLVQTIASAFNIFRLHGIKQLGFLQDPTVTDDPFTVSPLPYEHTRLSHSADVTVLATLIGKNCELSPRDLSTLTAAGLVHDALTPAGGDSIKTIDPDAFDEDRHFPELLTQERRALLTSFGIEPERLATTIIGEGMLGTLLDIADKIAYVSTDLWQFAGRWQAGKVTPYQNEYWTVRSLARQHPHITSLWECVRRSGEQVYFDNPHRLGTFLKMRAFLFRNLYFHPGARFGEQLVAQTTARYLYERGELTRDALVEMTDGELERRMDEKLVSIYAFSNLLYGRSCGEWNFPTIEAARRREQQLWREGYPFTFTEELTAVVKPGTHFLTQNEAGNILPLRECLPQVAQEIEEISRVPNPIRLYYIRDPTIVQGDFLQKLVAWRKERAGQETVV